MSLKRKIPPLAAASNFGPKRQRSFSDDQSEDEGVAPVRSVVPPEQPRNDPIFGQKHAFPGLDDDDDGALSYGESPTDGLEYLRMVRSEARTLPPVFATPLDTRANGSNGSPHTVNPGFYSDGAWVFCSLTGTDNRTERTEEEEAEEGEEESFDAQETYYNLLRHRFQLLRSTLKCTPPAPVIASLGETRPIYFPRDSKAARDTWTRVVRDMEPTMAQLACMDVDSVLGVLGIVAKLLSQTVKEGDSDQLKRMGAWAWGLLARCRDVGEFNSQEIWHIRDLGKRAGRILSRIRDSEEQQYPDEETGDDNGEDGMYDGESGEAEELEDSNEEEIEASKARLLATLDFKTLDEIPSEGEEEEDYDEDGEDEEEDGGTEEIDHSDDHTSESKLRSRAMLDMILNIVGEFYGQRDLLESRDIWMEDGAG